jgi:DNA ligase 1
MATYRSSPILVSKTRTGNEKFWQAHVGEVGGRWFTNTTYWQVNKAGVKSLVQSSDPYESTPKNVGKSNETSAKDQAESEFDSMVKKQRDKGYTEPGTVSDIRPLPMLAHKFKERGTKMKWPVYVQPKYNGMRMLFDGGDGWSRGGKDIIPECIAHIQCDTHGAILDGELILPGNVLLQETMKATKKYRKGISDQLQYIVYDIIDSTLPFSQRYEELKRLVNSAKGIVLAPTKIAEDVGEVMEFHNQITACGFEGTIIRDDSGGYEIGQRSNQLQKFKDFQDAEFIITDVVEGDGRFKGAAVFVCENKNGVEFRCTPEGTMEYRRGLYDTRKKLIGKWLTIRFQELSKDGVPLFPVGVSTREDGEF